MFWESHNCINLICLDERILLLFVWYNLIKEALLLKLGIWLIRLNCDWLIDWLTNVNYSIIILKKKKKRSKSGRKNSTIYVTIYLKFTTKFYNKIESHLKCLTFTESVYFFLPELIESLRLILIKSFFYILHLIFKYQVFVYNINFKTFFIWKHNKYSNL